MLYICDVKQLKLKKMLEFTHEYTRKEESSNLTKIIGILYHNEIEIHYILNYYFRDEEPPELTFSHTAFEKLVVSYGDVDMTEIINEKNIKDYLEGIIEL